MEPMNDQQHCVQICYSAFHPNRGNKCGNDEQKFIYTPRYNTGKVQYILLGTVLSPHYAACPVCIAANCSWYFVYCVIILCVSLLPHVYFFYSCTVHSPTNALFINLVKNVLNSHYIHNNIAPTCFGF